MFVGTSKMLARADNQVTFNIQKKVNTPINVTSFISINVNFVKSIMESQFGTKKFY